MCKYAQSTSPLYLSFLDRAIHMAAHEEAGLPSPSGEAHEHFGGAEPWGTSPPVQTDQLSEGELEEVGQEDRLCGPSLPATPDVELVSVGSPLGSPQSPPHVSSVAGGGDEPPTEPCSPGAVQRTVTLMWIAPCAHHTGIHSLPPL